MAVTGSIFRIACVLICVVASGWIARAGFAESQPARHWGEEGRASVKEALARHPLGKRARNVVLFIGDGMGVPTVTAARILEGQLRGKPGEENRLVFERFPYVALAKTYNTNQQVPDSAGTMTAIATGSKTRAGVVSVDESVARGDFAAVAAHRLPTLAEQAEDRGLSTGIVTTTTVTHATPAALYAHSPERGWESDARLPAAARLADFPDIARQLVEFSHGDGLDVVLGGGLANFLPAAPAMHDASGQGGASGDRTDARDLTAEWVLARPGSVTIRSCTELDAVPESTRHLLGLFAPSHMAFEHDRPAASPCQPSLAAMTAAALAILRQNEKGYVLMVEGGRIDHGHHLNNAYRALTDALAFARAVEVAVRETSEEDTLIVVTADHGHVLTLGGYPTRGNDILGLVVGNDARGEPEKQPSQDGLGLPFTTLGYYNGPGYVGASNQQPEGVKHFPHNAQQWSETEHGRPALTSAEARDPNHLQESALPMRSETHSGEDVPVYARGPGASLFHGVQEQSYLFHAIVEALGWNTTPDRP